MRFTLRVKWTFIVLSVSVLPLFVSALLVGRIQRDGLFRAEQELENAVVDEASGALSRSLANGEDAVHRTAMLLGDARIQEEARLELARDAVNSSDIVSATAIFGTDGTLLGAIEKRGEAPAPREIPVAASREKRPEWLMSRTAAGLTHLHFVEPVVVDGAVTAWVVGEMRPSVLNVQLTQLSRGRFGREDRLVVVDRERRVVAGDATTWPAGRVLPEGGLFEKVRLDAASFDVGDHAKTSTYTDRGIAMVGTVRVMSSKGWAVAVERPESEAFGALTAARRAFLATATGVAALALVLGTLLARRATRPIRELVELTRAYGRREFARKSPVRSRDELQELGDSLGKMADDLSASEVEITRRAAIEAGLARYLPAEVARAIGDGTASLALGGRRVAISVLFADAASFTSFAEKTSPELVVALLNELFTVLTEVVFRHGGMVDKFMGDCIMAVFGAHDPAHVDHVARALAAAEDMHRFVEASAPRWKREYAYDVRLGIGLSTGESLVGNLGSEGRMEFTAVGDSVNVASRLETLARPGQTLVTQDVMHAAGEGFAFHSLGMHPLRGKAQPVEVLEVLA